MAKVYIHLFGKFCVQCNDQVVDGLEAHKVQALFCYLLIHPNQQRSRETLAGLLWGDSSIAQSKKNLRQTLWYLQSALARMGATDEPILMIDSEWIQVNPKADCWVDVVRFERAWMSVQDVPGAALDQQQVELLRDTVGFYQGDLLEGNYEDWCVYARERLQNLYLAILDKLMVYCQAHNEYETGLLYGAEILKYDRARERTHRQLMRLYYLAGDRAAALRQYERCVAALEEELCITPDNRTGKLYEQIRSDQLGHAVQIPALHEAPPETVTLLLSAVLSQLQHLQAAQAVLQRDLQQALDAVGRMMDCQPGRPGARGGEDFYESLVGCTPEPISRLTRPLERALGDNGHHNLPL